MKRAEVLNVLISAAEQVPPSPQLTRALHQARKAAAKGSAVVAGKDYAMLLQNTGRALECIADGLAWAQQMRAGNQPTAKILPVVAEQNRKALKLLEA